MHECFPKHFRVRTARMKLLSKATDEEVWIRGVSMERNKAGIKQKRSPDGQGCPNLNAILIANKIC